jgi:hypothetical protein
VTLRRLVAFTLVAMWACQEVRLVTGWRYAGFAGIGFFVAYFLGVLATARASQRWVIAGVSATAVALAWRYSVPDALLSGIRSAVLFAAFLATMQMLRVALESSALVGEVRSHFARLSSREQHDSVLLRAKLVASVLGAGALAVVAPILAPDVSGERRKEFAQSALQGIGLAVLWSPFFVAMAVATRFVTGVSLGVAVANGLVMGAIGFALSHFLYGERGRLRALLATRRTLVEAAILAGAIILANYAWGLSSLEAVVIGIPILSVWVARRELRAQPAATIRRWVSTLESIAVEALVVGSALVLGEVVNELVRSGVLAIPHGPQAWPVIVLIALPPFLMLGISLLGLHPIVTASCLLPLLTSIDKLHGLVVIGSVLLGWMLSVVLSTFVVPVMYAATVFGVRHGELVRGRNLRFCAAFVPIAVAYLWALNAFLLRV